MPARTARLLAISDLHINHRINREALATIGPHPDDWLVVAGDVGERPEHLVTLLESLTPRFAKVIWTAGNHDLWETAETKGTQRTKGTKGFQSVDGHQRYDELVQICRDRGAVTPEDPYLEWPGAPGTFIGPMFLLFDYTFRPSNVSFESAIPWARETGVV